MKALQKFILVTSLLLYKDCLRELKKVFAAHLIKTMKRKITFRQTFRLWQFTVCHLKWILKTNSECGRLLKETSIKDKYLKGKGLGV